MNSPIDITNLAKKYLFSANDPKASTNSSIDLPILISGNNNLYNDIYCTLVEPNEYGFNSCNNCEMPNGKVWKLKNTNTQNECVSKCKDEARCTSYSYYNNKDDIPTEYGTANCIHYINFPSEIKSSTKSVNSGYSVTKYGLDYVNGGLNGLTNGQKENIKKRCANQYLNNKFNANKSSSLLDCLSIETKDNNTTRFNMDPQCIYNKRTTENLPVADEEITNDYIENPNIIVNSTDPIIDKNMKLYNDFYNTRNTYINDISNNSTQQISNFQNANNNNINYYLNASRNNTLLREQVNNSLVNDNPLTKVVNNLKIITGLNVESFENANEKNTKKNTIIIVLILLLILFFILMFNKK